MNSLSAPGWLVAYFLASVLAHVAGIPYPIAFLLILGSWFLRDRVDFSSLHRAFASGSALDMARRDAAVNPANADAQFQAGQILVERKEYAAAVPYLRKALERMAASAEVQSVLGTALLHARGAAEAEPHLRRANEIEPRFRQGEAHIRLAEALTSLGRAGDAYDILAGFFSTNSTHVEALYRMGVAARAAGREPEAKAAFAAAKEAYRTNPPFRRQRDRVWTQLARRALGERVIADRLVVAIILGLGLAYYLWLRLH